MGNYTRQAYACHLLPLEKAWLVRNLDPVPNACIRGTRTECLHSRHLCLHPRGSNSTEGSCAAHKLVGGHSVHPSKHPPTVNAPSTRHPERSEVLLREPCAFQRTITISRSDPMQNPCLARGSTKESL